MDESRAAALRELRDLDDDDPTLAGGSVVSGELSLRSPGALQDIPPGWEALALAPRHLASLMLLSPIRAGANLVALEPGVRDCALTVKRGTETLGAFRVPAEVGMAAALRLAASAGIDPLTLGTTIATGGASGRVKVRTADAAGEVLVCLATAADGLVAEVRPLSVEGRGVAATARASLRRCPACGTFYGPRQAHCEADGSALVKIVERPEPGGSIGVYSLGAEIGHGGMGVVIAGEHAFLGRQVAIKLLHRSIEQDPYVGRRFLSEARAASQVRHPGIVEVLDYGLLEDGRPYIVMERIEGESLEDRLARGADLQPEAALLLIRTIAVAMGAAHERGVVHLDLKPANIILLRDSTDADPRVKIIDFGAAARAGCVADDGLIVGTPEYMSPEHARGEPADARSDFYSLGVLLYELLSGKLPFDFEDTWRIFRAHLLEQPDALVSPSGPLPEAVHAVVARALRKKPAERHQVAAELVAEIDAALTALRRGPWLRWLP